MPIPAPGTAEHAKLHQLILRKLRASENAISPRHESWRRSERTYRLYVNPSELQEPVQSVTDNAELLYTYPTSIVIPLSYAMIQTVVSYWVTLFTGSRPYFRIDPADKDSIGPARAQELLLNYQLDYIGFVPLLYTWLLDSCRYGVGVVKNGWDVVRRNQTVRRTMHFAGPTGPLAIQIREKKRVLEYEGNVPEVIDPFTWRPDHRWPIAQFQRGSFCGEALYRSYFELLRQQGRGIYEHIDELKQRTTEYFRDSQSDRDKVMETNKYFGLSYDDDDGLVLVEEAAIDIIPKTVGLSSSTDVERWLFALANRAVVIRAEPFPYDHNDFTYAAIESSPDWHALANPGLLEIMEPVHQHLTWLINTVIENARKSLNDRLVVDPSMVNMDDLLNPSAGKTIRLQESFWGIPGATQAAITQLKVEDVAAQNYKHMGFLIDLLQRVSAATETIQGQVEDEERTATEISSAAQSGSSRLRTMARLFSAMGLVPMARQMVQNNMQLLSQEAYLSIAGGLEQDYQAVGRSVGGNGVLITPEDIQGQFHFPVSDASMPLDPVRFARTWVQVLQVSMQNEGLANQLDLVGTWKEMVRAMGIQDPSRLILPQQVQVMPDDQLAQQVQAGNLVPQGNGATPPPRSAIPMQQQRQSINGQENRPL